MIEKVYIVVKDNGDTLPELWAFADEKQAEDFCSVRGADSVEPMEVIDEHEAKVIIDAEAKERADEEKFDRMRDEGLI